MKKLIFSGCLLFLSALSCMGQTQQPLCPKHIETPIYPAIAKTAHISGKVVLTLTIDADGKVSDAKVMNEGSGSTNLLGVGAVANIRLWTFAKPPSAPYVQTIVYDYEFDESLPPEGGPSSLPAITKVNFDLPDHVAILTNLRIIDVSRSREHN
jgi:TonB family protein